jgi:methionine synthase II (cobalamin-independent)
MSNKRKWEAVLGSSDTFAKVKIGNKYLELKSLDYKSKRFKEENSIALLISKAPEMLEFIQHCVDNDCFKYGNEDTAKQLIKEVTEL